MTKQEWMKDFLAAADLLIDRLSARFRKLLVAAAWLGATLQGLIATNAVKVPDGRWSHITAAVSIMMALYTARKTQLITQEKGK